LDSFEERLAHHHANLSPKLRQAADYVLAHPIDVATRSLRSVAADARLSPATFSRMCQALGYADFEGVRTVLRQGIAQRSHSFSQRLAALQEDAPDGQGFHAEHIRATVANLRTLQDMLDAPSLNATVARLHEARKVLVLGGLGSTGVAEYLTYMASLVADNWSMGRRMGASLAGGLVGLGPQDAVIVITHPPSAVQSRLAAEEAQDAGAFVVVITDSPSCPTLKHASTRFIVPSESPHYFSSYAATLVFAEVLTGMLARRAGDAALERLAAVETRNRHLQEVEGPV
jgi:DNA-binding MurR/RpiR family transcriptional regulator